MDAGNRRVRPAMIHHAVLGSLERFIAMLLEHHRGALPLWLAPEQAAVALIGESRDGYARQVAEAFERGGLRVVLDDRPERLPSKIMDAREAGIPMLAVIGEREVRNGTVGLRRRDGGQVTPPLATAVEVLAAQARPGGTS